ncbi:MAG: Na/Pi symporter, partial [Clostridiales bacterium]|nr:Na/Pi symporter [Clostridiales bacterium]
AGESLRSLLNRFTGGTVSSIAMGAIITLLVQSSTATSLMTIGFVSAGMLTFLQATGVIFGANLGTTSTGWMVALIGLKFSVSQLALPIIGIGMILKQFSSGRWAQIGYVLTGFGLIFVGIQYLQSGMAGLDDYIDFTQFSDLSILNRLILIIIGIIMTIIMQSSSAAVATTITVLAAGTIGLEQAIALVIGQNIGTTATVAFASIGASVSAKRTALAHIFFNLFTGAVTFIFFPLIVSAIRGFASLLSWEDPLIIVALFHTLYSILGIVVLTPFIKQFTKFIIRLQPEKKSDITKHLDSSIIPIPAVATETAMRALKEAAIQILEETSLKAQALSYSLPSSHPDMAKFNKNLEKVQLEIDEIKEFVMAIRADSQETTARYTSLLHAIDHLQRMARLAIYNLSEVELLNPMERVYPVVFQMEELILESIEALEKDDFSSVVSKLSSFSQELAEFRKKERAEIFEVTAKGEVNINDAFKYVKLILLVDGITHHLWRMMYHISEGS